MSPEFHAGFSVCQPRANQLLLLDTALDFDSRMGDALEKRKPSKNRFIKDFREAPHKNQLMMTYDLSPSELETLLKEMVKAGDLGASEVEEMLGPVRHGPRPRDVQPVDLRTAQFTPYYAWVSKRQSVPAGFWARLAELGKMWVEEIEGRSRFRMALALIVWVFTGRFHYIQEFNFKLVGYIFGLLVFITAPMFVHLRQAQLKHTADTLEANRRTTLFAHCEVCGVLSQSEQGQGSGAWEGLHDGLRKARTNYPSGSNIDRSKVAMASRWLDRLDTALGTLATHPSDSEALAEFALVRSLFSDEFCDFFYPKCKDGNFAPQ